MKLKAYAKINFSLRVFEKRPDGFHNIESVMQSISLCDYLTLQTDANGIDLTMDTLKLPADKRNLAAKAAELFFRKQKLNAGVKIHLQKNIPIAAGLAGGSADAAAVLLGLNQLFKIPFSDEELSKIGAEVGSDVPFCLVGGTCLVTGRGEKVAKLVPWHKTYIILVNPDIHVSTKWAYETFDDLHVNAPEEVQNDLEPVVAPQYPVIGEIKEKLLKLGCSEAQMSGSGPTVFGKVKQKDEAERIIKLIKEEYPRCYLAETIDRGVEVVEE
jgi:4-diphosphocytidyl-2-C-methyl-D-erythritol kinase